MTGQLHGSGYAYRCGECDGQALWRLTRRGDVAVDWACSEHFSVVALDLQRDHEVTELVVVHAPKAREWAGIQRSLADVAKEGPLTLSRGEAEEIAYVLRTSFPTPTRTAALRKLSDALHPRG